MGNCWFRSVKADSTIYTTYGSGDSRSTSKDVKFSPPSTQSISSASVTTSGSYPPTPKCEGRVLPSANLKVFSFNDLKSATRNFRPDSVLGEGGFGCVFKGWIDEHGFMATKPGTGMVIAVKKLNQEGLQGHKEWLAEVNYLGQLSHPNLVKLIGYCTEDDHLLLVYEFMPKGSLENHLFRTCTPYNAKLSDFGLAKDGPTGNDTHVSTRVMGTYGYAAPEYMATGHLTAKSDVYGFGVVLLEMLSGLRAVDTNRPAGQHKLVEWAKPYLGDKRKLYRVMDHRLENNYPPKGAHKAAMLALHCLSPEARSRPHMKEVVERLEQVHNMKDRAKYSQPEGSGRNQSVANGNGHGNGHFNLSPHNMNYPSPGPPRQVGSPLHSYQRSPRQR